MALKEQFASLRNFSFRVAWLSQVNVMVASTCLICQAASSSMTECVRLLQCENSCLVCTACIKWYTGIEVSYYHFFSGKSCLHMYMYLDFSNVISLLKILFSCRMLATCNLIDLFPDS